jgi:SAM-dependent methyltransferase
MRDYLFGWRRFNIQPTDTVLEVGSGNRPLIRSDILCDKYPFSSYERFYNAPVVIDRPFIAADAQSLPFKDNSIDFIYSGDLAEHLDEPNRFFDECARVARKGAIVTPSLLAERLFGWEYHAVMYELKNEELLIQRKTAQNSAYFGGVFHELWLSDKGFRQLFNRHPELFRMSYEWEGTIRYRFVQPEGQDGFDWCRSSSSDYTLESKPSPRELARRKIRSTFSAVLRKRILRRPTIQLESLLCCPACRSDLTFGKEQAVCNGCKKTYPVVRGVPILILDDPR